MNFGMDMEGSGLGLFQGTILSFSCRYIE